MAVLLVFILKLPVLGTESIGTTLEWVFYVTLPNFCFGKALQDLFIKHQFASICSQIDEYVDRVTFCKMVRQQNETNHCCSGELLVSLWL